MGNSQSTQITKNVNIKRFTVTKLCSEDQATTVTGQPFASAGAMGGVTHGSTWSSQQKPEIDVELSMSGLWRDPLV